MLLHLTAQAGDACELRSVSTRPRMREGGGGRGRGGPGVSIFVFLQKKRLRTNAGIGLFAALYKCDSRVPCEREDPIFLKVIHTFTHRHKR